MPSYIVLSDSDSAGKVSEHHRTGVGSHIPLPPLPPTPPVNWTPPLTLDTTLNPRHHPDTEHLPLHIKLHLYFLCQGYFLFHPGTSC